MANLEPKSEVEDDGQYEEREVRLMYVMDIELKTKQHNSEVCEQKERKADQVNQMDKLVAKENGIDFVLKSEQTNDEDNEVIPTDHAMVVEQKTEQNNGGQCGFDVKKENMMNTFTLKIEQNDGNQNGQRDWTINDMDVGSHPKQIDEIHSDQLEEKRMHFMYVESTNDDDVLYCEECKKEHKGDCPIHGPLIVVQDSKVEENDPDRALHSLPPNLLIKVSGIDGAGLGVFTDTVIQPGTKYGPYEGIKVTDIKLANSSVYCWQIHRYNLPSHFIDAKDTASSNWMRYVNCPLSDSDQNLQAFQYKGDIYYRCIKPILPKTELLVWYGNDCAGTLGIRKNNPEIVKRYSPSMHDESIQSFKGKLHSNKIIRQNIEHFTYKCKKCNKAFKYKYTYIMHRRKHSVQQSFHCGICKKTFFDRSEMNKHSGIHKGQKTYKCEVCDKTFISMSNFNQHLRIHTGERPYDCDICGKTFNQLSILYRHSMTHTGERPFECVICCKKFSTKSILNQHSMIHTDKRPYNCEVCGKAFSIKSILNKHSRLHIRDAPYKCGVCGETFSIKSFLNEHSKTHGEIPYTCEICGKTCGMKSVFNRHTRIHTGEKPYKCEICGKAFNQSSSLKRHTRIHTGEKPYNCEVCSKTFTNLSTFKQHSWLHTGEKPFKCKVCGKTLCTKRTLNHHSKIHTGETPHRCEVCDMKFINLSRLNRHSRIHTGERPYKCEKCGKTFNHLHSFKRHSRVHT